MDVARKSPLWITVAATAVSAALFYFGTGIHAIAALTWLAPIPVLLLAPRVPAKTAAIAAFLACLLGAANNLPWYVYSPSDAPLWPMGVLIMLGFSVPFALGSWAYRALLLNGRPLPAAVALPAIWTAILFIVATFNPTGIMGTLAGAQGDVPVVLQAATVTGMWGVEFLLLFVPTAAAAFFAPGLGSGPRLRAAGTAAVVLALVLAGGAWRLAGGSEGRSQTVALLSNNDSDWGARMWESAGSDLVAEYAAELETLPPEVDTVVLPEGEFTVDDDSRGNLVDPLTRIARDHDLTIVVGFVHKDGTRKYNHALAIPPSGKSAEYLKHHDTVSVLGDELAFQPGHGDRIGLQICADLNFSNPSRDYGRAGSALMLVPAADERHNGWLHARSAMLQTVANGSSLAWSARTGTLTIADGYGRVLAERRSGGDGPFTRVIADVPLGPGGTLYSRLGDWFAWLCVATALAAAVLAITRPAKPGKRDSSG